MNAPLPQPTEPTNSTKPVVAKQPMGKPPVARPQPLQKPLQKGVAQQVAQAPVPAQQTKILAPKPGVTANYKPGQMPAVKPKQPIVPKPAVPDLNKSPVGVVSAKPPLAPQPKPVSALKPFQAKSLTPPPLGAKPPSSVSPSPIPPMPGKPQSQSGQQPPQPKPPQLANPKKPFFAKIAGLAKDPKKLIMMGLAGLFIVALVGLGLSKLFGGGSKNSADTTPTGGVVTTQPSKQTVVTYWGLWEPSAVLEEVLSDFETANPGVKVDYRVQSHKDYRERLQTAIASGNGPDIFRYHASWVPMLVSDLAVMPSSVMSASEFKSSFYPVASEQLQVDGKIVGVPLMYDGLGLYYNKEVLETAGVEPPETWAELKQLANELTVPADKAERKGGLQRGGLAIGNASNVEHYSDILGLLILQNGGDPSAPAYAEVKDALTFYTNFISQDNIWDSALPSSTVAFARGEAVMMMAPSWRAHEVMELNPSLDFAIAALPQLSDEKVTWSSYWAEGVSDKSKNKNEAWLVLKYLSSPEVMKKLYSSQAQVRTFGEPYSRVDLAGELATDPYVGSILNDANYAAGLYMSSFTHDNGLNDQVNEYYMGAINAFLQGGDQEEALTTLETGVGQVLRQYQ